MLKNWKSLFVKTEDSGDDKKSLSPDALSFPVNITPSFAQHSKDGSSAQPVQEISDPAIKEVIEVYEKGLDSINMPGYDFYEFYQAITNTGQASEQAYNMAYHMAKTLDKTITPQKLMTDAEFYISKINEVYSQYVTQGQQKLSSIQEKKNVERNKLNAEIDQASMRISQLRAELHQLETDINTKRTALGKIDDNYYPQEKTVREKLNANDLARRTSIDKLNRVKEGIQRFIKG